MRLQHFCFFGLSLTMLTTASNAVAQHHIPPAQTHQNNNSYAPINFPTATVHFPNNTFNFPNNAITFPNNNFNFPNNAINFPSYNTNFNNSNNSSGNYSPYVNGFYGGYAYSPNFIGVNNANYSQLNLANTSAIMGFGTGFGAAVSVVPHHYQGMSHHYRVTHHSTGNRANSNKSKNTLTAAQRHYNQLVSDLDSLPPQFAVLDSHRNILKTDVSALVEGTNRPTSATVQQLSHNLANAMTRRKSQVINTAVLANDLRLVMNSGHLPKAQVDRAIVQTQTILKEGGFNRFDIQTVVADMHAVAAQVRANEATQASAKK